MSGGSLLNSKFKILNSEFEMRLLSLASTRFKRLPENTRTTGK
jgi:hypothetical protein